MRIRHAEDATLTVLVVLVVRGVGPFVPRSPQISHQRCRVRFALLLVLRLGSAVHAVQECSWSLLRAAAGLTSVERRFWTYGHLRQFRISVESKTPERDHGVHS
jgi:hypothetical protein